MGFSQTSIEGVALYAPNLFTDSRGAFFESYRKEVFEAAGIRADFVQDNQASSVYGVIRGLHYQLEPYAQAKLIRVLSGKIRDVALDIRRGSPTYGKHVAVELSAENRRQLYVPRGFAHGYAVISPTAEILYKCDNYYRPSHDTGIAYNDKALAIDWGIASKDAIVSAKDASLPPLKEAKNNFAF